MFIIVIYNQKVYKYYSVLQDSENCKDLEYIEQTIIQTLDLGNVVVYNLDCFKDNIYVDNNSRSNYFANKHLIKYICKYNNVIYQDLYIDTNKLLKNKDDKKVYVVLENNITNKSLNNVYLYNLISDKNFINTLITLLSNKY